MKLSASTDSLAGSHDALGGGFIANLRRDVRFSLRLLRKSPGFTITAVLTLALGIGANAVVFAVLNGLILRPLNVPNAGSLYGIERLGTGYQSYPDYLDLRDHNHSFDELLAYNINQADLDTGRDAFHVWIYETSGNYFDGLHVQPLMGRLFHASDEHGPNSAPYIVLSYGYWHTHFQDDPGAVGRTVQLNKYPFTIIGVVPPEFKGTLLFGSPDFYVPIVNQEQIHGESLLNVRGKRWVFELLGHLKSGVTPEQASADLNSIGSYLEKSYPKDDAKMAFSLVRPSLYGSFIGRPVRMFVTGLLLVAGLILLAVCANLGSLFAARAADRSREVALRLALGSTRKAILRQLLTEATLISIAGGAVGLAGSIVLLRQLSTWQPFPRFPVLNMPVNPDARVYVVALVLALLSGILFGMVPIRQVFKASPYEVVKTGATTPTGRRITFRDLLLVGQIAICAVLVTFSMVAVRGLMHALNSNFGFEPRNTMLANTDLSMAGYTGDKAPAMQKRMIEAMERIPGVKSVGIVDQPPLSMGGARSSIFDDKTADLTARNTLARPYTYRISPEYFESAETTLLAGRTFSWHDDKDAPRVAIVNRQFAEKVLGSATGEVGRYFKIADGTRIQVAGIVEDGKYFSLTEEQQPAMFLPILQSPASQTWLIVRANSNSEQLASAMREEMRGLDKGLPFYMEPWKQEMDGAFFASRMATVSLGLLGVMGALLSITGIFGMAAYSVSKRLRELGLRVALGAQRKEVIRAALGRAFKLLALGSVAGMLLGILGSRVLAFIVYQATPRDPLVLAGVVLIMLLLGLLATWIPSQRALAVDPLILMREE